MAGAKPGARLVQIGAGSVGCLIIEALATRGVQLSVVETGDRMVPSLTGRTAGGSMRGWCATKGVAVHTGAKAEAIERPDAAVAEPGLPSRLAHTVGFGSPPAPGRRCWCGLRAAAGCPPTY